MFMENRDTLLEYFKQKQADACVYNIFGNRPSPQFCDCKYEPKNPEYKNSSEVSGCPELRCVIALLETLTDEEYAYLAKRRGNALTWRVDENGRPQNPVPVQ